MINNYYIAGNRTFTSLQDAEKYCIENDFDFEMIIEAEEKAINFMNYKQLWIIKSFIINFLQKTN